MIQLKSILGKSVEENELMNLTNLDNQNLSHKIKNNFEEKRNERLKYLGKNKSEEFEKNIFLQLIDQNWKFHIQYLEQLRGVIGLRSYGQRDPLVEYKKEAFSLFENLLKKLKTDLITILFNIRIIEEKSENKYNEEQKVDRKYVGKKMKRNEPCYCGSGKKFKHCCGAL